MAKNLDAIPHIVYDCTLPLPERLNEALTFKSARAAADYLGMPQNKMNYYTSVEAIAAKRRYKSQKLGKQFAIRMVKNERK